MLQIPTFQALYALVQAEMQRRRPELTDFNAGSMADAWAGGGSALADEAIRAIVLALAHTFVDTAEGADLDRLVNDHLNITRIAATKAIGTVRFQRANTGGGNTQIDAGKLLAAGQGAAQVQFVTTGGGTMTGLTLDLPVEAATAGTIGNVGAVTIITILSTLTDPSITASNAQQTAGGRAPESDVELRARVRRFFQTLRRGTIAAVEYGALLVGGVVQASVDESQAPITTVYVADINGAGNLALANAVKAELVNWRAAGKIMNVEAAVVVNQPIAVALAFKAGVDTAKSRDLAIDAILLAVNALEIGETLFHSAITAGAKNADGIADAKVTNPAGDVIPTPNQIIRSTRALVSI